MEDQKKTEELYGKDAVSAGKNATVKTKRGDKVIDEMLLNEDGLELGVFSSKNNRYNFGITK